MAEKKKQPYRIRPVQTIAIDPEGIIKVDDEETALFTKDHTANDILDYLVSIADVGAVEFMLQEYKDHTYITEQIPENRPPWFDEHMKKGDLFQFVVMRMQELQNVIDELEDQNESFGDQIQTKDE